MDVFDCLMLWSSIILLAIITHMNSKQCEENTERIEELEKNLSSDDEDDRYD